MEPQQPDYAELEDEANLVQELIDAKEEAIQLFHEEYEKMENDNV